MADQIKLDYRLAEAMVQSLHNGQEQLQETLSVAKDIVKQLSTDDTPLAGDGGTAYREAIDQQLGNALQTMIDKFEAMQVGINAAIKTMQRVDAQTKDQILRD